MQTEMIINFLKGLNSEENCCHGERTCYAVWGKKKKTK